ncbi:MAG: hypothetical protein VZR06_20200, partial [Butyrivibrio sp.]|nr:hypothetical protein [Butyrivibrio sp.]
MSKIVAMRPLLSSLKDLDALPCANTGYLYSLSAGQKEIFIVFSNQITGMHRYAKLIRIKKCENTHKQVVSTLF